ncbi:MAG: LCP family protein, partial [Anaerolineae bacterium]|nr:LCP family protein [Anaerolineae bacterium]
IPATPTVQAWDPHSGERINILLLGVDKRPSEQGPPRTDTMIVVTIDPTTGHVGMLSIPRDLWVHIPVYDVFGKVNTAHVVGEKHKYPGGGPALAKRTISELIGYPIHYYVKVNFDGFRRIIDLIGGIDIYVPRDINDPTFPDDNFGYDPLFIPAGQHHMNGDLALKYARTRHVDDDYNRARRQQQVLLAIKERVMRTNMLPSLLIRLPRLVHAFAGSVETDIPLNRAIALASLAHHLDLDHVEQVVIDRRFGEERNDPQIGYVLIPDRDKLRPVMDELFGGLPPPSPTSTATPQPPTPTPTPTSAATPQPPTPAPTFTSAPPTSTPFASASANGYRGLAAEQARVAVLDGSNRLEVTASAAEWLRGYGLQIVRVGKAERPIYPHTIIRIFIRKPLTVAFLQDLLGNNVQIQDLSNAIATPPWDIEIVLGKDFMLPEQTP